MRGRSRHWHFIRKSSTVLARFVYSLSPALAARAPDTLSVLRMIVRSFQPCVDRHLGDRVRHVHVGPVGHLNLPGDTEPLQYVLRGIGVPTGGLDSAQCRSSVAPCGLFVFSSLGVTAHAHEVCA